MAPLPALAHPRKTYSFTDFSRLAPAQPLPGDRLDTELDELRARLTAVVDVLQGMLNGDVVLPEGPTTLTLPGVVGSKVVDLATGHVSGVQRRMPVLQPVIDVTPGARQILDGANAIIDSAREQAERATLAGVDATGKLETAIRMMNEADDHERASRASASAASTYASAAEGAKDQVEQLLSVEELAAMDAISAQQLAWKWAEYLSGPVMTEAEYDALDPSLIPPGYTYNPVTGMGTAGLWSSKWWAVKAQQDVGNVQDSVDAAQAAAQAAQDAQTAAENAAQAASDSSDSFSDVYLGAHATAPTLDLNGSPLEQGDLYYNTVALSMRTWSGTSWDPFSGSTTVLASDITSVANAPQGIAATNVQAALDEIAAERATVTALAAETTARQNADSTLTTNLNTEITNRQNADTALQSDINTRATSAALTAEINNRIADVDSEETARIAADNTLSTNLATETTNRTNADTALQNNLNTETSQRQSADTTLQSNIDAETSARTAADALKVDKTANTGAAVLPAGTSVQRPGSPAAGYVRYNSTTGKFEGFATAWGTLGGGAAIADTPPSNPAHGDLWWESDTGTLYIRYDDGSSQQWVQVNPAVDVAPMTLAAQKFAQLAASPNMLVNGDFGIDQLALSGSPVAAATGATFFADQWSINSTAGLGATAQRLNIGSGGAGPLQKGRNRLQVKCTTAKGSLAAGDYLNINQTVEGASIGPLTWGLSQGRPAILRFGFKGPAGTYGATITGLGAGAGNNYIGAFTVAPADANVDKVYSLAIPPPPATGLWDSGITGALAVRFVIAAGSTGIVAPGWQGTPATAPTGQFNGLSSTSNVFEIFDVRFSVDDNSLGLDPGFNVEPFDAALARCQRYLQQGIYNDFQQAATAAGQVIFVRQRFAVQMRNAPTMNVQIAGSGSNMTSVVTVNPLTEGFTIQYTCTAVGGAAWTGRYYYADARL